MLVVASTFNLVAYRQFLCLEDLQRRRRPPTLIDLILASSDVIALSPNKSLNGVNPIDFETIVL
jgi:hypothetical protein